MRFLRRFRNKIFLQTLLMVCGLVTMALGVFREEVSVVLKKAIYICLECIGIG